MISRSEWRMVVLAAISAACCFGCNPPPPPVPQPPYKPSAAAAKAIELYDANKDGMIAGPELDKTPALKASLKVLQTDKDKGITSEQIIARIKKWKESQIGVTSLSCQVFRNGQPLVGATVKFVPDPFLADALMETATGTTNQAGMAMLSVPPKQGPDPPPPGLPPGIYRVEITKGSEIPAKYNTATILGQEVSPDNIAMQMGVKFQLKY